MRAVHDAAGPSTSPACTRMPNYTRPEQPLQLRLSARSSRRTAIDFKTRFDWNISNNTKAYVRIARESGDGRERRAACGGRRPTSRCRRRTSARTRGRSYSGNVVSVLSPTMTNEVLVSYSRLTLDNPYKDPERDQRRAPAASRFNGIVPGRQSPYLPPTSSTAGAAAARSATSGRTANDMYAHNDALQFSDKLTKLLGAHGLKFGVSRRARPEAAELPEQRGRPALVRHRLDDRQHRQLGRPTCSTGASAVDQGTAARATRAGQPDGEFRYWNIDAFAQDSWKLRPNFTLEYGVRVGYWTNNAGAERPRRLLRPDAVRPDQAARSSIPGTYQRLNGVCYVANGCAPAGILDNRSPFALPRVNVAWDIDGEGNNVLRGGYGHVLQPATWATSSTTTRCACRRTPTTSAPTSGPAASYGNGLGLTYDTLRTKRRWPTRSARIGINTLTPDSFKFPKTHSFSVSYARRIPWNQVVEASYVGTRGRRPRQPHQRQRRCRMASLSTGTFGGVDLSVPVNRVAVDQRRRSTCAFRPFNALTAASRVYDFEGVSDYNSLQVTLSRQTGQAPAVLRRLHLRQDQGHARRRVPQPSIRSIRAAPTASSTRTARTS